MQRWHLTFGLAALALGAAWLAPRLLPLLSFAPPSPEVRTPEVPAPEVVTPQLDNGSVVLNVGLDHRSVSADVSEERFLVVEVQAPMPTASSVSHAVDVGVVLDTSSSMTERGKIDYAKLAAMEVARQVRPGDSFALVTFNNHAEVVIPSSEIRDLAEVERRIKGIQHRGATNLADGLRMGQQQVLSSLSDGDVGRVILLSDGKPSAGETNEGKLISLAASLVAQGISVSTVGLGLDYNENLLASIADYGGGSYDFVDDPRELTQVFVHEFDDAAATVARNVRIHVALPKGVEPIDVVGWDSELEVASCSTGTCPGWAVTLGDLRAGDVRKIVARVRVNARWPGEIRVAEAHATYDDLILSGPRSSHAIADVAVHTRPPVLEQLRDARRWPEAQRAFGNWLMVQSTEAYAANRPTVSKDLLNQSERILRGAAAWNASPDLVNDVRAVEQLGYAVEQTTPLSTEGKKLIKGNKERFRVLAR